MKLDATRLLALLLAATCAASTPALAQDAPANARVTAFAVKQPYIYRLEGDRFKRVGALDLAAVVPPVKVLSMSRKGYIEVEGTTGPVWLDKMDVKLDPPASLWNEANCNRQVTGKAPVKSHVGMGAGEGCKQ